MNILVNCSSRLVGGGLQVADSLCCSLSKFPMHNFIVVLSKYMKDTRNRLLSESLVNVEIIEYTITNTPTLLILGRDRVLDSLIENNNINAVITVFGPIAWIPKCPHICGFARSQLLLSDSPYYSRFSKLELLKEAVHNRILKYFFERTTKYYYTENAYITEKVEKVLNVRQVVTITNYYNQIFDNPQKQSYRKLPDFDGVTLQTISKYYPHKNLEISIDIAKILREKYPDFKFRFVFSIDKSSFPPLEESIKDCFYFLGTLDISECPSIYEQSDIAFQPTLLECFTATYPEAMRMEKPIITTDIAFAKGLCKDAAIYYSPLSAEDAANKIYLLANDKKKQKELIEKGKIQLKTFDTYDDRAKKIVEFCESIVKSNK